MAEAIRRHGHETVYIEYDPTVLDYKTLLEGMCLKVAIVDTDEQLKVAKEVLGEGHVIKREKHPKASVDKRLFTWRKKGLYRKIPMTEAQASKVHFAISGSGKKWAKKLGEPVDPDSFLFPSQVAIKKRIETLREKKVETKRIKGVRKWQNSRTLETVAAGYQAVLQKIEEAEKQVVVQQ